MRKQPAAFDDPPDSERGTGFFRAGTPTPQHPVSGRVLPVVLLAVLGVALAGFVMVPQLLGGWLGSSGAAPWAGPSDPAAPSFAGTPPPGFTVAPATGSELVRFEGDASSVSLILDPDLAMAGSEQLACAVSLGAWARVQGVDGNVERTGTAMFGTGEAAGVRLDAAGIHAVQRCLWVDDGGLLSVRGTSPSGDTAELDAAMDAVASGVTLP
ncbi:MAG TPA: hypothetical protein VLR88_09905 [Propionibacteriaceae bacterium]|nr:hypothetical protein [Propionibacteriaceae bacterium]